ncbi:MAG: histidinol dehydrogenase [Opitutales bacterium]
MTKLDYSQRGFWPRLQAACNQQTGAGEIGTQVRAVLEAVQAEGDAAVLRYTELFDGARLAAEQLKVAEEALEAAAKQASPQLRKAVRASIRNVSDFHRKTLPKDWSAKNPQGATVGERFFPIRRVGLYIPGGQVPLVSTVIMTVTLAKLAGCPEIVVATPPAPDGTISDGLMAALWMAGAREVYRVGGVQALAAMAYGTQTIRPVDKLFGPGATHSIEAKRQLFGTVGVDLLPGPSEVMVIADGSARADWVAADLLAQAEHGTGKEKVFLVTTSKTLAGKVEKSLKKQLEMLSHAAKIREVLSNGYVVVLVKSMEQSAEVANFVAPEHLELHASKPACTKLAKAITTAGSILIGAQTPTVLGDFTAGPSHTLPTGRTGRFLSGLQLIDFMRRTSLIEYSKKALAEAAPVVRAFAEIEQLDAHGRSLEMRLDKS